MSLRKNLDDLAGAVGAAAAMAPDEYDPGSYITYEFNMAEIRKLWAAARPKIRRDLNQATVLDGKLNSMLSAFEAGDKKLGRKIAWDIYNSKPEKLK
ncbi:MAG TPA: hypothetical protein VF471_12815 [Pseudoxanthomonas sp.]